MHATPIPYVRGIKRNSEDLEDLADSLVRWVNENVRSERNFTLGAFAFWHGIRPGQLIVYARRHEGFKEAYLLAKEFQEHMVTHGALHGTINSRFAQFHLGCNHGWKMAGVEDPGQALKTAFDGWVNKHLGTGDVHGALESSHDYAL
jgi:hypothetical protein